MEQHGPGSAPGRNGAGVLNVAGFVVGAISVLVGLRLATVTRINLETARTSSPYLVPGVLLVIVGAALVVACRAAAKRRLVK